MARTLDSLRVESKFGRDTAVRELEPGVYEGQVNRDWWIVFGPNGGFLAAMMVKAMGAAVADDTRAARSLTIHYTAAPKEGPIRVRTTIERAGRSLTTISARMEQGERLIALALGAFSKERVAALEYDERRAPEIPPPEAVPVVAPQPQMPPFSRQWELRYAIGKPPFGGDDDGPTISGGWIAPLDEHPVDAALVAQITDAWLPAVFIRLAQPNAVPTIDLTIHFRAELPLPPGPVLVQFESRLARGGFVEEDGWIWSREGDLIAQSRQLALLQAPTQN